MNSECKVFFIYKIKNLINNKLYIGKSYDPNLRFGKHLWNATSRNNSNECGKLYNSIRKYGKDMFILEIINFFHEEVSAYEAENFYINHFNTIKNGMNIIPGGIGSQTGILNPMFGKGYLVAGNKNPMYGKSGNLNPFYGKKHSEKSLAKMRKSHIGQFSGKLNYFYGKNNKGENHPRSKIDENTAKIILEMISNNIKPSIIYKTLNINADIVYNIKSGKTWRHLANGGVCVLMGKTTL